MKNENLYNEYEVQKNDISKHVSWITIFQLYDYILRKNQKGYLSLIGALNSNHSGCNKRC